MNVIIYILAALLVETSTAIEMFYVLPDHSSNISCPPHQCATLNQYLLDNNGTLPVVSNVEYHFLLGEHYLNATEMVAFTNFQNFSLVGKFNEQLQLLPVILVGIDIAILDSCNITITNIIFKSLFPNTHQLQLVICISCTIENVTLIGCGLTGYDLIGKSYLNGIVISLIEASTTEYECYDHQGIMLQYGGYLFNESKQNNCYRESILIKIQNISIYHDNSICPYYADKGIIKVKIGLYQMAEGSIEIIICDSKFENMVQKIIDITDDSKTTTCIVWIMNCTFESNLIHQMQVTSLITAEVPQFNVALNLFDCKFYHNKDQEYLVSLKMNFDFNIIMHRDIACTNITFSNCTFMSNRGGLLYFNNLDLPYCEPSLLFIGPIYIDETTVTTDNNMIYIHNTFVHIHGPVTIFNNTAYYDIMVFDACKIFTNGPMIISHNLVFAMSIISLHICNVLFRGPITISDNLPSDSIMQFISCDITFDKHIIFISNECDKIITIKSKHTFIKVIQHTNITFLYNKCYDKLIDFEINDDHNHPYSFCLFQFIATTNKSTVTSKDYTIMFIIII